MSCNACVCFVKLRAVCGSCRVHCVVQVVVPGLGRVGEPVVVAVDGEVVVLMVVDAAETV